MRLAGLIGAALLFMTVPATAQMPDRTIESYDVEVGVKYAYMTEEGGYVGTPGFLFDGGYGLLSLERWRLQGIAELSFIEFEDFDSTYTQFAAGLRLGTMVTRRLRAFGQFQLGIQNDGFEPSNDAFVIMPGGGVNYVLTHWMDVQAVVDIPFALYGNDTFNQFRLSVGVALPLGKL